MSVQATLGLSKPPIAIGFFDVRPPELPRWSGGAVPAGCAFWREAMQGKSFYTEPGDHYNCAVGAYTHSIDLPASRAAELGETVGFMVANAYLRMEEVPGIPKLEKAPSFVAYAPADAAPFRPDVVLVAAKPASAMLLYEAALRAGAGGAMAPTLGRPGCAVLPLALLGGSALSLGCKGNRTFTGLPDEEMYFSVSGEKWSAVVAGLNDIHAANQAMERHYQAKVNA